jgi:hypothetical protein
VIRLRMPGALRMIGMGIIGTGSIPGVPVAL